MNNSKIALLALIAPLAACGGSGSPTVQDVAEALGAGVIDPTIIPNLADAGDGDLTVEEIATARDEFLDEFEELLDEQDYTDLTSLPDAGTANFAGIIAGARIADGADFDAIEDLDEESAEVVGEMTLTLALEDDSLSGSVTNLQYTEDGFQLIGELTVAAELDRDTDLEEQFGILGTITGDLQDDQGEFGIDAEFGADLFGENAEALAGVGLGEILVGDEVDGSLGLAFGLVNQGALD